MNEFRDKTVTIPAPEFEQYETVLLDFNELAIVQITNRWYEFDKDYWYYQCYGETQGYYNTKATALPQGAFSHITDDFDFEEFKRNYRR